MDSQKIIDFEKTPQKKMFAGSYGIPTGARSDLGAASALPRTHENASITTRTFRLESAAPIIMVSCGAIGIASIFIHQPAIAIVCVALGLGMAFGQPALESAGDDPVLRAATFKQIGGGVLAMIVVLSIGAISASRMGHPIDEIVASEGLERDARFLYQADTMAHHDGTAGGSWTSLSDDQRAVWRHRAESTEASIENEKAG